MITIPKQQVLSRWDTLSDILRETLTSETNSKTLWDSGRKEHLSEEKISVVAKLAGYVLMGFLHPEDITKEIQDALGINPNIAASIANTLNNRIFNPLKNELEKIYAPAVHGEPFNLAQGGQSRTVAETPQPKIVQEIEKPFYVARGKPKTVSVAPTGVPAKTFSEIEPPIALKLDDASAPLIGPKIISTPLETERPEAAVAVPAAGRSLTGSTETAPTIPSIAPGPSTKIPAPPKPTPIQPSSKQSAVGSKQLGTPGLALSNVEGPVILHQESELGPIKQVSGFKLEIPDGFDKFTTRQKFEIEKPGLGIPPRPAQVEMGPVTLRHGTSDMRHGVEIPKPPLPPSQQSTVDNQHAGAAAQPRVIHYSESRTPFDNVQGRPLAPEKPATSDIRHETGMPKPPSPISTLVEIKPHLGGSSPAAPALSKIEGSLPNRSNSSNGSDSLKPIPIPTPPTPPVVSSSTPLTASHVEPPSNLPVLPAMPQKVKPTGILGRIREKISPAKKFLPDPLKEPELPKP